MPELRLDLPTNLKDAIARARPGLGPALLRGPWGGWTWLAPGALAIAVGRPAVDTTAPALIGGGLFILAVHAAVWALRRARAAKDRRTPLVRAVGALAERTNQVLPRATVLDARIQAGLSANNEDVESFYATRRAVDGLVQAVARDLRKQPPIGNGSPSTWHGAGGELSVYLQDVRKLAARLAELDTRLPPLQAQPPTPANVLQLPTNRTE